MANKIIRELAKRGYITDSIGACVWCREILWSQYGVRYMNGDKPVEHAEDCIYRRAVEIISETVSENEDMPPEFWAFAADFSCGFGEPSECWNVGSFLADLRAAWLRGGPEEHADSCGCQRCTRLRKEAYRIFDGQIAPTLKGDGQ